MKRIVMIPPFEVLTGNLSGKQNLQYAENNNPAYEAPNGTQGARNYVARYVGAKRSDGKTYFAVRRKNTSVLNGKTRMMMALIGSVAAIKSAIQKNDPQTWSEIRLAYDYAVAHAQIAEGVSFNKWVDDNLRSMLRYKRANWSFTQASASFDIANPFKLDNTGALTISQKVWNKFALVLGFTATSATYANRVVEFVVNGSKFINPDYQKDFVTIVGTLSSALCPNLRVQWTDIACTSQESAVTYKGLPLYTAAGVAVIGETEPQDKTFTTERV